MASLPSQADMGSNPPRKVRIVAKIRGFSEQERKLSSSTSTAPWVSLQKPDGQAYESVSISFADPSASRNESYELDGFYEQKDGTDVVFLREVKPLVSGVFDGFNATIIACGARGSGKSYLIQGTDEKPGVTAQAMAEILLMAEESGKSVTISYYEVYQDHVYDLLDPKRSTVSVLEDAQGKIQLKGLSEVPVKSISEFHKLYYGSLKAPQKTTFELPRRSHKGLIVYVSSSNANSDTSVVGKMNFVDLAGYEDSRRKSSDGYNFVENAKINKSLYALQNVVLALNVNESRVPYRESKLTRVLQDSLGVTNKILMVTCLNPLFCQDSMCMVKLASRSCQSKNPCIIDSTKKNLSVTKQVQISKSVSVHMNKKTASTMPVSEKKVTGSENKVIGIKKKVFGAGSAIKARNLFAQATHSTKSKEVTDHSRVVEATHSTKSKDVTDHSRVAKATHSTKSKEVTDHSRVVKATHSTKSKEVTDHSRVAKATHSTKSKEVTDHSRVAKATHSTKSKEVTDHSRVVGATHSTRSKEVIDHSRVVGATHSTKSKKVLDISRADEATYSTKSKKVTDHSRLDEATHSTKSKKASFQSLHITSTKVPSIQEEEKSISVVTKTPVPLGEESSSTIDQKDMVPTSVVGQESSLTVHHKDMEPTSVIEKDICVNNEEVTNKYEGTPVITGDTKDLSLIEESGHCIDKENKGSIVNEGESPPLSVRLRELSNTLKSLHSSTPLSIKAPLEIQFSSTDIEEPKTPTLDQSMKIGDKCDVANFNSPWGTFSVRSTGVKNSLVQEFLRFLNTATKEELKGLKGIGEKRATYILELREETLEPFETLDDLKDIGLTGKQIKEMMKNVAGGLFN